MIYAYYRVSTEKQDYNSQKMGVVEFAKRHELHIDREVIDDGVSGTILAQKRNLGQLLNDLKTGDVLITAELSRLGRSTADVINTCNALSRRGVICYLVKQNMTLDQTPMGKMMIAIFAAFAEMERDLISIRTKEGFARMRAQGIKLGRPFGGRNRHHKLDGKEGFIKTALKNGMTKIELSKKLKTSIPTINKFIKDNNIYQ